MRNPSYAPERKQYSRPKKDKAQPLAKAPKVFTYLTCDRKLTAQSLKIYKVGSNDKFVLFPLLTPEGELMNIKNLSIERGPNGEKTCFAEKDCAPILFGWQSVSPATRTAIITEGEIDAITMFQYTGVGSLSIPFGAGANKKNDWIDLEWENLERFDLIYLCFDNDGPGRDGVEEVAKRLGIHRCKIVILPHKDANECLQKGVDGSVIGEALVKSKSLEPREICQPDQFKSRIDNYFDPSGDKPAGFFPSVLIGRIGFRPGELTVWSGISSHGKSAILGMMMLMASLEGQNVAIASMEMRPEQTLGRLLRQLWAARKPIQSERHAGLHWMSGKIWIYDLLGVVSPTKLLELMKYSRCRHGVEHFVIDSLMKCAIAGDDYNAQGKFLNEVVCFAKETNSHVHLVAHSRKGSDENKVSGKMDIKGSSDIFNQADNVLIVWRNKDKEMRVNTDKETYSQTEPDAKIFCDKQRESGWEGVIDLIFRSDSLQFAYKKKGEWAEDEMFYRKAGLRKEGELPL